MRGKISSPGITGAFTRVDAPATLSVGSEINVKLDGNLYNYDFSWWRVWTGCFTAERTGYRDYAQFGGSGVEIGPEWAVTLGLGPMPDSSVNITVKLWGNPYPLNWDWGGRYGWVLAATRPVTIFPTGVLPPECDTLGATECRDGNLYTCVAYEWMLTEEDSPECEAPKVDWRWVALGGGALLAGAILFRTRR